MTNSSPAKKRSSHKKRQLQPLSLEEALSAAGMSGFVSFLNPLPAVPHLMHLEPETPPGPVSTPESVPRPGGLSNIEVETPSVVETPPEVVSTTALQRRYPREKIFRATAVQHGHSAGEQCLYQAMWNAGTPQQECRILHMGYRGLAGLANLNPKSVKANLRSLEHKLAIEIVSEFSAAESSGRTYRIFPPEQVLARREAAGMLWVRKIKGVEFIL